MTTVQPEAPPDAAALLELSDERDLWQRRLLGAEQAAYARGYADAQADMAAAWHAVADPVARGGPKHAELEERRWGPEGREHFGDPRPGDFPGRRVTAA